MALTHRWQINLTYDCNLACKDCIQYLDVFKWKDAYIDPEDILVAGRIVQESDMGIGMLRISGGEPTLHPEFSKCCKNVLQEWKNLNNKTIVCTNTVVRGPRIEGIKYRPSPPSWKEVRHRPCMLSPKDLGIEPVHGWQIPCSITRRCGTLFDTYGFAACGNAGSIGRLLKIDPYDSKPVLLGPENMCEHCVFSVPKKLRLKLWKQAEEGKIKHPTKTYQEGIERDREERMNFKLFKERRQEDLTRLFSR